MTFTNETPAGPTSIILLVLLIAAELATFGRALLAERRAQVLETSQNIPEQDPEVSKTAAEEFSSFDRRLLFLNVSQL